MKQYIDIRKQGVLHSIFDKLMLLHTNLLISTLRNVWNKDILTYVSDYTMQTPIHSLLAANYHMYE
jgi:hypothetical protein